MRMRATHLPASISRSWNPTGGRRRRTRTGAPLKMQPTNSVISFVRRMSTTITASVTPNAEQPQNKSKIFKLTQRFIRSDPEKSIPRDADDLSHLPLEEQLIIKKVQEKGKLFDEQNSRGYNSNSEASGTPCRWCRKKTHKPCCVCQHYFCDDCSVTDKEEPDKIICTRCQRKKVEKKTQAPTESPTEQLDIPVLDVTVPQIDLGASDTLPRKKSAWEADISKQDLPRPRESSKYLEERTPSQEEAALQRRLSAIRVDNSRAGTVSRSGTVEDDVGQEFRVNIPVIDVPSELPHNQPRKKSWEQAEYGRQEEFNRVREPVYSRRDESSRFMRGQDDPSRYRESDYGRQQETDYGRAEDSSRYRRQSYRYSQEEVVPVVQTRRPSTAQLREIMMSRSSTQEDDPGQDLLMVPGCVSFRRKSDTGPQRIQIPVPELPRRKSDTGPNRARLAEFMATWTGKVATDRRLSEAGGAQWGQRSDPPLGRRMSEAGWNKIPVDIGKDLRGVELSLDKRPVEKKLPDINTVKRSFDARNKWSLDSGLCPPMKDPRERRLSEGLPVPRVDNERRLSDVGPGHRSESKAQMLRQTFSDSLHDSQSKGSSASESSGAEDDMYRDTNGRRKIRKTKALRNQKQKVVTDADPGFSRSQKWAPRQDSRELMSRRDSSELSDNGPDKLIIPPIPPRRDSQTWNSRFNIKQISTLRPPDIFVQHSDEGDSSPSPDHPGWISMARRMSRGDNRIVMSDCEGGQEDLEKDKIPSKQPRHSWPEDDDEVQLQQAILSKLRALAPPGTSFHRRPSNVPHDPYENRAQVRQVILQRASDDIHRTCGLGMRVVGGKACSDGHLWTHVAEVMPGGPADLEGIVEGDRILTWDSEKLVDRTFEEVNDIITQSGDIIEITVEHRSQEAYSSDNHPTTISDIMPTGTRRKLPKTPQKKMKENVSSRIQVKAKCVEKDLVVTILDASNLRMRSDNTLPEVYVKVTLHTLREKMFFTTDVAKPSCNPCWIKEFVFCKKNIMAKENFLDISVWDYKQKREKQSKFLGDTQIYLVDGNFTNNVPIWYELQQDPNKNLSALQARRRSMRKTDFQHSRSLSDERDEKEETASTGSMVKSTSADWTYLHPDYGTCRRTSSSGSEKEQQEIANQKTTLTTSSEQRRKFSQKVKKFSRSLSLKSDKRPVSVGTEQVNHDEEIIADRSRDFLTSPPVATGSKWQEPIRQESEESTILDVQDDRHPSTESEGPTVPLGPGQMIPRGLYMNRPDDLSCGEIKLSITLSMGSLNVKVICARDLPCNKNQPPDTYVKTYLKEGSKVIEKKKTRVVNKSSNPQYNQILKHLGSDALHRSIQVIVRQHKFRKEDIGMARIDLTELTLSQVTTAWYRLFPVNGQTYDSDSI